MIPRKTMIVHMPWFCPVANENRGESRMIFVDRSINIETWFKKNKMYLQLDLRSADNHCEFAKWIGKEKTWANSFEELTPKHPSHQAWFHHFNLMIVQSYTACKEHKMWGPVEMIH